jgi:hypothetical protein
MRDRFLLLAPGLGLYALVLVASAVHTAPKGLLLGLAILLLIACGGGVILSQDTSDGEQETGDSRYPTAPLGRGSQHESSGQRGTRARGTDTRAGALLLAFSSRLVGLLSSS